MNLKNTPFMVIFDDSSIFVASNTMSSWYILLSKKKQVR